MRSGKAPSGLKESLDELEMLLLLARGAFLLRGFSRVAQFNEVNSAGVVEAVEDGRGSELVWGESVEVSHGETVD